MLCMLLLLVLPRYLPKQTEMTVIATISPPTHHTHSVAYDWDGFMAIAGCKVGSHTDGNDD